MAIEFRHLHCIVAASQHGSLRKAAEVLGLKQSTLSRRIREAEEELGLLLFQRGPRGTFLTVAGREFLTYAQLILQETDSAVSRLKSRGKAEIGRLAIGFYTSLSAGNLRATLREHKRRWPQLDVTLVNKARTSLLAALNTGVLDIAIMPERSDWSDRKLRIWSERAVVVLSAAHRLASRSVLTWTDLQEETFLFSQADPGPELQSILMSKLALIGERPNVELHYATSDEIKVMVDLGFGLALMWESSIDLRESTIVFRPVQDGTGPSHGDFTAYWRASNDNPALGAFIQGLRERYPGLPSEVPSPGARS